MKKIKKLIRIILIVIILELTIFNFRYYTTKFSGLQEKNIKISQKNVKKSRYQNYQFTKLYKIEINEQVKGIKLNIRTDSSKDVKIKTTFTDESAKYEEKELDEIKYNKKFKNSEYIVLNSQKDCITLNLYLTSPEFASIESVDINTWYFDFNICRVLILCIIAAIISYKEEINDFFENKKRKRRFYIGFISIIMILYSIYVSGYGQVYETFVSSDARIFRDPYKLLTESILEGRVDLQCDEKYKGGLLELSNYKDYSERIETLVPYIFDVAFYNNNYYCYFGITPVITVLLPLAILTGKVFYSNVICVIYFGVILYVLFKIHSKLVEKFNIKMNFVLEFLSYVALLLSTGILICIVTPNFYQAAQLSGIAWGMIATLLVLNLDNNKKIKTKLFFIGLSYGLMVCSRPIYVLYIIPLIIGIFKYIFENKKIHVSRILAIAIPIILIALMQMYYNYIRFDNPFEFGQFYQLTVNDPSEQKVELGMAIEGTIAYLFNPPRLINEYPFILVQDPNVNNGNVVYSESVCGLFWFPYMIILLSLIKMIKTNKIMKQFKIISFAILLIGIIILATTTCIAGMNQRYLVDIQPALAILACACWFIYLNNKNIGIRKEKEKIYKIICCIAIMITFMYGMNHINENLLEIKWKNIDTESIRYNIKDMIEFYK